MSNIRNFCIIAHIDHGKSTLADRMLEITGTIEKRRMRDQVLDTMDLERERGITIKMQPVRMIYKTNFQFTILNLQSRLNDSMTNENSGVENSLKIAKLKTENSEYILNLIDTPGHIDFGYEVSRALKAVEGAIVLVDATQGVQAQTLSVISLARQMGVMMIPVINKIDMPIADVENTKDQIVQLLHCDSESIILTSGKTGAGVVELLEKIVRDVPPPEIDMSDTKSQALIFDYSFDTHKGMIVYVRVMNGTIVVRKEYGFAASGEKFEALEVGTFSPARVPGEILQAGEIGYVITGLKKAAGARVGDTIIDPRQPARALEGYSEPRPMVWASLYPEKQEDFVGLRQSLERLKLSDASLSFEEETSGSIGRGFRCGFLGMLHLEIVTERLRREFNQTLIITSPTIQYEIVLKNGKKEQIYTASKFPDENLIEKINETWISINIITPPEYTGQIMQLFYAHEVIAGQTEIFGDNRTSMNGEMPLRELMRNFFDELKSVTSGYASLSYTQIGLREANVTRLDILVADEVIPAFSKVVSKIRIQEDADDMVERLKTTLPRQMFDFKVQAKALGRIIASRSMSGMKKDVTAYLYGGDITRKMKLREKQKKGKKKMKAMGRVEIPQDVFLKMMKPKDR
ncbi:MAG: elongation factor 4 [Candidatus Vogelbacteria bacterium]|nr:elongation factor 4 [Candidatus Vogelbacteria bacterium]